MSTKRIISFILLLSIFVGSSFTKSFAQEDTFHNKDKKIELFKETDKFKTFYDPISKVHYVVFKSDDLSDSEKDSIINELTRSTGGKSITIGTCLVIIGAIVTVVSLAVQIDDTYFKEDREARNALAQTKNGWVSLKQKGKTLWFFKRNGNLETGWLYDESYKGWYYFSDKGVMFDPKYSNSEWIRVNNKWYEFSIGGKLKEYSCWRKYNNKWLYHIPNDFGAVAGSKIKADGTWYEFDSNGYLK